MGNYIYQQVRSLGIFVQIRSKSNILTAFAYSGTEEHYADYSRWSLGAVDFHRLSIGIWGQMLWEWTNLLQMVFFYNIRAVSPEFQV